MHLVKSLICYRCEKVVERKAFDSSNSCNFPLYTPVLALHTLFLSYLLSNTLDVLNHIIERLGKHKFGRRPARANSLKMGFSAGDLS